MQAYCPRFLILFITNFTLMINFNLTRRILSVMTILLISASAGFAQYCTPVYTTGTTAGDYIDGVSVGAIANTASGGAITGVGYSDYTFLSTDLTVGMSYTMTLNNNPTWSQTYTAWIDYDHDFVFETTEVLGNASLFGGASGTITFSVPIGVMGGETRMRVRCIYPSGLATPLDPCTSATYGETEDYTVNIMGGAAIDAGVVDVTSPVAAVDLGVESVTVTIQNMGSEPISGFSVSYSVDGGAAVTEVYAGVIDAYSTASHTFATTYDFTADVCYDIMAYTTLDGDEYPDNDDYTETVCNLGPVTGTGAFYIYSNVTGGEPWFSTSNTTAMTAVFGAEGVGWNRAFFETVDPLAVFNSENCFVFLEGSDGFAIELENFLTANMTTIENWVASGGKLLLNAAPNEGDGMSFGFGGTSLVYAYYTSNATSLDATHPIFNGPFMPAGLDYSGTSFGHARVTGTGLTNLMADAFALDNIVLAEKAWGDGMVMFGGMTTDNWHDPDPNASNLRANIIAYLSCLDFFICMTPGGQYVDGITDNDAVCHWDAVDGADQYRFVLQNTFTGVIAKRKSLTNSYDLTDKLDPLTTYAFRVKTVCYDEVGDISAPSPWYYWTTLGRMGEESGMVSLYPNPNNGTFTINVNGYANNAFTLNVLSATGQIVHTRNIQVNGDSHAELIALDNIPAGLYQVSLNNEQHTLNYSIVVTK